MLSALDAFSRSFAAELLQAFAQLENHASARDGVLKLELSPGTPRADCHFYVSTEDGEVTVGLGNYYHSHFDWPPAERGRTWDDPIAFIRALIAEELLIVDRFRDGKWTGSSTMAPEEVLQISPGETVHVRSWSGARDRALIAGS